MASEPRVGDVEVGQDLDFQRREWTIQRAGWVVMAVIAAAGLLGLFGGGPLSDGSAEQGPFQLDYGRFERKRAPAKLRVEIAGGTAQQGQVRLWLDEGYLDQVELRTISPEPEQFQAGPDCTVYVFNVSDPGQPATVSFDLKPNEFGALNGRLGLVDGPELEFTQLVSP